MKSTIWGGRFEASVDDIMEQINASIGVDQRLYSQDIKASKAHAAMLAKQAVISEKDNQDIQFGLDQILTEIESGKFEFKTALEDIHMNIETRLKEIIGEAAGRLHTARSRNDQVATDFRLWTVEACASLIEEITSLQDVFSDLITTHKETIMPGFTHLQVAQPVTLGLHLDAYNQMLSRDRSRFEDARRRMNYSPLGAAALSGTSYPIDREATAKALGFDGIVPNTMDAVGSRDFALEFLFACAQMGLNLSRLAEEIVLWTTPQFGFMKLSDAWSTGSSIMPQKKNPDAAELVRAKTGRLSGNLVQLMMVMKALPLTYNKDMQEDKAAVFESFDTVVLCLRSISGMLSTAVWNKEVMREAAESGYATATEIADWLVKNLNLPFRDAHHVTGRVVKLAEEKSLKLSELSLADMQAIEPRITDDIFNVLSVEGAIKSRNL
ncbi:MAG: argininosuccinate lyase [Micavibrio aeruginosavorus]|uniref:Argininosuccinate lyase n=1 Tax=Micavibrio aeruginosavorus TaxID=349221 RepID=A0A2W5FQ85_9BACT|nr:MAG: argininosuccinate lyase [Micavibrio aeruginosavorus]